MKPPASGRALVLGGGGFLGAIYEIGVLSALERRAPGGRLDFDLIVGTSGGSVVASLLAAGYSASELLEMSGAFTASNLTRLDRTALAQASIRVPFRLARKALAGVFRGPVSLSDFLAVLQEAVPAGLLTLQPLAGFLHEMIRSRRTEDSFADLPHRLYIPAIDLDTGERIVFGDPGMREARVSLAVAASCAVPRFFKPVSIEGRDLIDGGIADALNLDVALERGAREILAVDPLVAPLNDRVSRCLPSRNGACGKVAEQGLVAALGQALKIGHMISTDLAFRLQRANHPHVPVRLIQPDRLEVDLDHPMDFRRRDRILALGQSDGARFASEGVLAS